jgi:hypothetical protein
MATPTVKVVTTTKPCTPGHERGSRVAFTDTLTHIHVALGKCLPWHLTVGYSNPCYLFYPCELLVGNPNKKAELLLGLFVGCGIRLG